MKAFDAALLVIACSIIIFMRIKGLDKTEGQIFVEYWYMWGTSLALLGIVSFRARK